MCPSIAPPGIFDLTAPHTSILVWVWGMSFLVLILLTVWSFRSLSRRIPPGRARHNAVWLYSLQAGLLFGWWVLQGLTVLWSDALTHWSAGQVSACFASDYVTHYLDMASDLQGILGMSALVLLPGGLALGFFANRRIRQARAALRQATPPLQD
jgi:hypothetical protein